MQCASPRISLRAILFNFVFIFFVEPLYIYTFILYKGNKEYIIYRCACRAIGGALLLLFIGLFGGRCYGTKKNGLLKEGRRKR